MPIRLAGHTYAFRELELDQALGRLAGLGFDYVEVWAGHAGDDPDQAARALDRHGLRAVAVSAGGFYSPGDDPERAVRLAEAVGAPVVVACVTPALLQPVADAVGTRVTLCVENHWDQPLATAGAVRSALAGLPDLRACLDTGHALLAGVNPDRFAHRLGPLLLHVHLKEARLPTLLERAIGRRARRRLLSRPEPVFPGRGALDVERLAPALARVSFDGTVTLEHEGPDAGAALAELRRQWLAAS